MHILPPETDNCPSWFSGRERMTVENISWSISTKECSRPRLGLNQRPPGLQSDGASNWATEACSGGLDRLSTYSSLFLQGRQLLCLLIAFLYTKPLLKVLLSKRKEFTPCGSRTFLTRTYFRREVKILNELLFLKLYSFPNNARIVCKQTYSNVRIVN